MCFKLCMAATRFGVSPSQGQPMLASFWQPNMAEAGLSAMFWILMFGSQDVRYHHLGALQTFQVMRDPDSQSARNPRYLSTNHDSSVSSTTPHGSRNSRMAVNGLAVARPYTHSCPHT